jgi:cytochrome c oxidase subunit II
MRADMERGRDAALRPTVIKAAVLGVIASIIGVVLGLLINWFPAQGSTQSHKIDTFWDVLIICSVPIFVLVCVVVLYSVFKFRMRPGEEDLDGPPIHGNTRLEVIWTSLPATILIALCAYAYIVLHDIEKAPAKSAGKEMNVKVIGQQFTWTFEYTGTDGKKFTTTQLYVPEGKSVRFDVVSKDVLHDFWVPAWRMKIDAVPGITTHYRITPVKTGRKVAYPVVCAELCGLGHAFMRQTAHIYPQKDFDAWMAKQSGGGEQAQAGGGGNGGAPAGGGTEAGKQVFASNNCASCHTLSDAGAKGTVGPDLDKALATKDAAFIEKSIVDPSAFVAEGFQDGIMPKTYGKDLDPTDLKALVQYLSTVTRK